MCRSVMLLNLVVVVSVIIWSKSVSEATVTNATIINVPAIFAFGDSILDTGNNNNLVSLTKANFPPYGKDFPRGISTGRFGNGKVFSDLMAEAIGIKETLPAYGDPNLGNEDPGSGVCFASAGSGLDELTARIQNVIPLRQQLKNFKEYSENLKGGVGEEDGSSMISESLFLISAGNNDIAVTYFASPWRSLQYNIDSYTSLLISQLTSFIKDLYGSGARKFGLLSTLPLGCLPVARMLVGGPVRQCFETTNGAARMFNSKLATQLPLLQTAFPGSTLLFLDLYNPLLDLIENPQKSGFVDGDRGCCGLGMMEGSLYCNRYNPYTCGNTSSCVFWDGAHPTEAAYRVLVSQVLHKLQTAA